MITVTQLYLSEYIPGVQFREDALTESQADELFDVVCHAATEIFGIDNKTALRLATIVRSICLKEDEPSEITYSEEEVLFTCSLQEMYAFGSFIRSAINTTKSIGSGIKYGAKSMTQKGASTVNSKINKVNSNLGKLGGNISTRVGTTTTSAGNRWNSGLARAKEGFKAGYQVQQKVNANANGIGTKINRGSKLLSGNKPIVTKPTTTTVPAKTQNTSTNLPATTKTDNSKVVNNAPEQKSGMKDSTKNMLIGAGTAAAAYGTYKLLKGPRQNQQQPVNVNINK